MEISERSSLTQRRHTSSLKELNENVCAFSFFCCVIKSTSVQPVYLLRLFALGLVFVYTVFYPVPSKGSLSCIVRVCVLACVYVVLPVLSVCLCSGRSGSCRLSGAPCCYCASRRVCQLQVPSGERRTAGPTGVEESR